MSKVLIVCTLLGFVGCANVTTMKLNRSPDGAIAISSGKDVTFGSLSYSTPAGEKLDVKDYSSNANTAAISAQSAREAQIIEGIISAFQAGAAMAAKGAK